LGHSRHMEFPGPAGRLEGILQGRPEEPYPRLAVFCHPHPLWGGTMHTRVVHRAARALQRTGHRVLRFNFRGVGRSEGIHDRGHGEREDVRAAVEWLRYRFPDRPVTIGGFSFGAWVGLAEGCRHDAVDALVGIAPPAKLFDFEFLRDCPKRKLFIHGTGDRVARLEDFEALYPSIADPKDLVRIQEGDHLLAGHLEAVEEAISAFGRSLVSRGWKD
jgi:alpha/beta superfamily hydrolase